MTRMINDKDFKAKLTELAREATVRFRVPDQLKSAMWRFVFEEANQPLPTRKIQTQSHNMKISFESGELNDNESIHEALSKLAKSELIQLPVGFRWLFDQLDGLISRNENAQKARAALMMSGHPVYDFEVAVEDQRETEETNDQVTMETNDHVTEETNDHVTEETNDQAQGVSPTMYGMQEEDTEDSPGLPTYQNESMEGDMTEKEDETDELWNGLCEMGYINPALVRLLDELDSNFK